MQKIILPSILLIFMTPHLTAANLPQTNSQQRGAIVTVGPVTDTSCDFNNLNAAVQSGSAEIRMSKEAILNEQ